MPSNDSQPIFIELPAPAERWLLVLLPAIAGTMWLALGYVALATVALLVALGLLLVVQAVGRKFELDVPTRRYRAGLYWAHRLNPTWQRLPTVQGVVVKPHSYRQLRRTGRYGSGLSQGVMWQGFTILLSVPGSARGVVVASVENEMQAKEIANSVAGALQVPWQRV